MSALYKTVDVQRTYVCIHTCRHAFSLSFPDMRNQFHRFVLGIIQHVQSTNPLYFLGFTWRPRKHANMALYRTKGSGGRPRFRGVKPKLVANMAHAATRSSDLEVIFNALLTQQLLCESRVDPCSVLKRAFLICVADLKIELGEVWDFGFRLSRRGSVPSIW